MIRFYKTIAKILRTLKSYLTGAVLKIVSFSYNSRYVTQPKAFVSFDKQKPHGAERGFGVDWTIGVDTNEMIVKKIPLGRVVPFLKIR